MRSTATFITAQPMKHEAYPLEPGKNGSWVSCHTWSPTAISPPRTVVQPATCQSTLAPLRRREVPYPFNSAPARTSAKMAAPVPVGAVTSWGRHRLSLLVDRR